MERNKMLFSCCIKLDEVINIMHRNLSHNEVAQPGVVRLKGYEDMPLPVITKEAERGFTFLSSPKSYVASGDLLQIADHLRAFPQDTTFDEAMVEEYYIAD